MGQQRCCDAGAAAAAAVAEGRKEEGDETSHLPSLPVEERYPLQLWTLLLLLSRQLLWLPPPLV